jgi:hypothetical protein
METARGAVCMAYVLILPGNISENDCRPVLWDLASSSLVEIDCHFSGA